MSNAIYSWQTSLWQQVWHCRQQQRLPHALLFVGRDGVGKKQFATVLANSILCAKPDTSGFPCGECHACHLFKATSHSGFITVEPPPKKQVIGVEQIREVVTFASETTLQGAFRVVLIHPATAMNVNAANALLKTLEEPPPDTLFILLADQGLRLAPTIRSRCQNIIFPKPREELAIEWLRAEPLFIQQQNINAENLLKLADGAPLKAISFLKEDNLATRQLIYQELHLLSQGRANPLQVAVRWQETDLLLIVDLLLYWTADLVRFKLTHEINYLMDKDHHAAIAKLSETISYEKLLAYYDFLLKTRGDVLRFSLNKQLLIEDILIRWGKNVSS